MFKTQRIIAGKSAALAIALASLTGCATTFPGGEHPASQYQQWSYHGSQVTYLPQSSAETLSEAVVGTVIDVGQTPWGESTRVTVTDRYFAASGRDCMEARVDGADKAETVNLCRYDNEAWGATPVLTGTNQQEVTP